MERMTFVQSRGLCDNCLVLGHRPSLCPRLRICWVTVAVEIIPVSYIQKCEGSQNHKSRQLNSHVTLQA